MVKSDPGLNFTQYVPSVNSYFTQGVHNVNSHLIPGMSRNYANNYSAQGMPAQTHDFRHGDSASNSRQYIPNAYQSEVWPSSVTHRKIKEPNTFDWKSSEWIMWFILNVSPVGMVGLNLKRHRHVYVRWLQETAPVTFQSDKFVFYFPNLFSKMSTVL